jgi:hypothetical protein
MVRAFFLAFGVYCALLGAECLVIDKATVASGEQGAVGDRMTQGYRELSPPDWAPWSLLSGGAVIMLYSFTLPQKMKA